MLLCHWFPAISPWNVWQLEAGQFVQFATQVDLWVEQSKESG